MNDTKQVSFYQKLIVCLLTGIIANFSLGRISDSVSSQFERIILTTTAWIILIILVAFIFIWQYLDKRNKINSLSALAFIQATLIYFLAFDFTKWGLLKILHLHMTTSLGWMEMPLSMLSGVNQLSHFFGQSYPMVVTLGMCEIEGAILILFRKTRLLGAFILFVMVANIVLLDILYSILRPLPEACTLLCGVLYVALLDYEKIVTFFFKASNHIPKFNFTNQHLKNLLKVSAIIFPCILLIPNNKKQFRPNLTGKYEIKKMTLNGKEKEINPCSDSTFSTLYFDLGDNFVLTNSHFKKRQIGHFEFNESTRQFKNTWEYPKGFNDTLFAKVSALDTENKMTLAGIMGKDTLTMELLKVKVKSVSKTY